MSVFEAALAKIAMEKMKRRHGKIIAYMIKKYGIDNKLSIPLKELEKEDFFGTVARTEDDNLNFYYFDDEKKMDEFTKEDENNKNPLRELISLLTDLEKDICK